MTPDQLIVRARAATGELRDAAREGRVIQFRQRDELVMSIHDALDLVEKLQAESFLRVSEGGSPQEQECLCQSPAAPSGMRWVCELKDGHDGECIARPEGAEIRWTRPPEHLRAPLPAQAPGVLPRKYTAEDIRHGLLDLPHPIGSFDLFYRASDVEAALAAVGRTPKVPEDRWMCGCGTWNGINLAQCGVCKRERGESDVTHQLGRTPREEPTKDREKAKNLSGPWMGEDARLIGIDDVVAVYSGVDWRTRALTAEAELAALRAGSGQTSDDHATKTKETPKP